MKHPFLYLLVSVTLFAGLAACASQAAPLPPEPTDTPQPPTLTPTSTPVWFPPTPTNTPRPTTAITPTVDVQPKYGKALFQDKFKDPKQWTLGSKPAGSVALGGGELTIAVSQPGGYLFSVRQGTALADFYAEVTASPSICKGGDEYGMLVRVSESVEFYRFALTCDGQARVDRYVSGRASSPQPPVLSGAVPPGAPSESRLAVLAISSELSFFANGEYLFSVHDPSLPSGTLGVFAHSNGQTAVTVNFSDLQVYQAQ